uniref:FH2 domain-containing protein n=2 Tax=Macrostomum lignano TaxID=282301 RepID=A0A1I8J446_9PLAT
RDGLSDRFSTEALSILKHCSSSGSAFLRQLSAVEFVNYGDVEYLSKQQDALETLSRALKNKSDIKNLVETAVEMKQQFDGTLEVLNNLLNFLQQLTDSQLVDLEGFRNSLSSSNLKRVGLGFLVDPQAPKNALQLKYFGTLEEFESIIIQLVPRFEQLSRSKTFERTFAKAMRLQFKRNNQQRLSIDLIVACLAASVEEWDAQVKNLMSDDATVHTVETFFGNLSKSPTELAEEF